MTEAANETFLRGHTSANTSRQVTDLVTTILEGAEATGRPAAGPNGDRGRP